MKIAIITACPYPNDNSATGNRVLSIAKGLQAIGDEVEILTARLSVEGVDTVIESGIKCVTPHNHQVGIGRLSLSRRISFWLFLWKYLRRNYNVRAAWIGGWCGFDLIPARLVTWFSGVKLIREVNEFPVSMIVRQKSVRAKARTVFERLSSTYFVDGMTLMTHRLVEFYQPHCSKRCRLIQMQMTVDVSRFSVRNEYDLGNGYIAYCGSMSGDKDGVGDLIRAFGLIAEKFEGVTLRLYGDGDVVSMDRLRHLVDELGLSARVVFPGRVPMSEIPDIVSGALILALIRPNNLQAQGGFPTKLGEYLSTGRPVVVTKVGEIPEYLTDRKTAFLCEPSNPRSAAECFAEILNDYNRALQIGREGRKIAEGVFNGNVQARKLHDLAEELVGGRE